ncbi:MAG: hypothetical protein AAGD11_00855 [Planctomycetota bacterium]
MRTLQAFLRNLKKHASKGVYGSSALPGELTRRHPSAGQQAKCHGLGTVACGAGYDYFNGGYDLL